MSDCCFDMVYGNILNKDRTLLQSPFVFQKNVCSDNIQVCHYINSTFWFSSVKEILFIHVHTKLPEVGYTRQNDFIGVEEDLDMFLRNQLFFPLYAENLTST